MPRYAHPDVLDNGLAYLKANTNKIAVISSYTLAESYAAVAAKILAEATMAPTDLIIADGASSSRELTSAAKTDTSANATDAASVTKHVAFLDTLTSKVLYVTPAPASVATTAGSPVNIAPVVVRIPQPVAV